MASGHNFMEDPPDEIDDPQPPRARCASPPAPTQPPRARCASPPATFILTTNKNKSPTDDVTSGVQPSAFLHHEAFLRLLEKKGILTWTQCRAVKNHRAVSKQVTLLKSILSQKDATAYLKFCDALLEYQQGQQQDDSTATSGTDTGPTQSSKHHTDMQRVPTLPVAGIDGPPSRSGSTLTLPKLSSRSALTGPGATARKPAPSYQRHPTTLQLGGQTHEWRRSREAEQLSQENNRLLSLIEKTVGSLEKERDEQNSTIQKLEEKLNDLHELNKNLLLARSSYSSSSSSSDDSDVGVGDDFGDIMQGMLGLFGNNAGGLGNLLAGAFGPPQQQQQQQQQQLQQPQQQQLQQRQQQIQQQLQQQLRQRQQAEEDDEDDGTIEYQSEEVVRPPMPPPPETATDASPPPPETATDASTPSPAADSSQVNTDPTAAETVQSNGPSAPPQPRGPPPPQPRGPPPPQTRGPPPPPRATPQAQPRGPPPLRARGPPPPAMGGPPPGMPLGFPFAGLPGMGGPMPGMMMPGVDFMQIFQLVMTKMPQIMRLSTKSAEQGSTFQKLKNQVGGARTRVLELEAEQVKNPDDETIQTWMTEAREELSREQDGLTEAAGKMTETVDGLLKLMAEIITNVMPGVAPAVPAGSDPQCPIS